MASRDSELSALGCLIALPLVAAFSAFGAWVFMLLWNWLMPALFGLTMLTFWQAWGICVLLSFVGGFFKSSK